MNGLTPDDSKDLVAENQRLREALLGIQKWFRALEKGTPDDDPLTELRRRFHAPVHQMITEGLDQSK